MTDNKNTELENTLAALALHSVIASDLGRLCQAADDCAPELRELGMASDAEQLEAAIQTIRVVATRSASASLKIISELCK